MTTHKTLSAALGAISVLMLLPPAEATEAPELYRERTCIACHGAEGRIPVMAEYPKLAGQNGDYLLAQMKDIKSGTRSNAHSVAMKNVMHMTSDEEMAEIAAWLGSLPE